MRICFKTGIDALLEYARERDARLLGLVFCVTQKG